MDYESVFQTASKILHGRQVVKFDPLNPKHREAYAIWELTGKWPIRFQTEWPLVTVPQTVLSALARHACSKEFENVARERNIDLKPGFESYFNR